MLAREHFGSLPITLNLPAILYCFQRLAKIYYMLLVYLKTCYTRIQKTCYTIIPEFLDSGSKRWILDSGHWILDAGLWTLEAKCWTLDSGLWTLDARCWTLDSGRWTLDATLRKLGSGRCTLLLIGSG